MIESSQVTVLELVAVVDIRIVLEVSGFFKAFRAFKILEALWTFGFNAIDFHLSFWTTFFL